MEVYLSNMENITLATKAEIQEEMNRLEEEYKEIQTEIGSKLEEWRKYIYDQNEKMVAIDEEYNNLKKEINKREGKNG